MAKRNFWGWFWIAFAIFSVFTWVFWFFEVDVRDIRTDIKDLNTDIRADAGLNKNIQPPSTRIRT